MYKIAVVSFWGILGLVTGSFIKEGLHASLPLRIAFAVMSIGAGLWALRLAWGPRRAKRSPTRWPKRSWPRLPMAYELPTEAEKALKVKQRADMRVRAGTQVLQQMREERLHDAKQRERIRAELLEEIMKPSDVESDTDAE